MTCDVINKRSSNLTFYIILFGSFFVIGLNTCFAKSENNYLGSWETTMQSPLGSSRYFLNISEEKSSGLSATVDEVKSGLIDIPVEHIEVNNGQLVLKVASFHGTFTGQLKNHGNTIKGQFKTQDARIPLVFTRAGQESQYYRKPRFDPQGNQQFRYRYNAPQKMNDGWETSSLKALDIDESRIKNMVEAILIEKYKRIHSVLVVEKGKLIIEEYFYSFDRNTKHVIHSDTKSVTSALIGIAVDQGHIADLHDPFLNYFEEYADIGKYKNKINLKHLLTMTGGFNWDETTYSYSNPKNSHMLMNNSNDPIKYVLERPIQNWPGERFRYNSGISIILGEIIRRATSYTAETFAEKYLFGLLDVSDYIWVRYPNGTLQTGGGLLMRPRDMAKFGHLFLSGGVWKGKRIISEKWINESTKEHIHLPSFGYGYQWWTRTFFNKKNRTEMKSFFAWGYGGQYIFVFPKIEAVAVFTGGNYFDKPKSMAPFEMLNKYIIPALVR